MCEGILEGAVCSQTLFRHAAHAAHLSLPLASASGVFCYSSLQVNPRWLIQRTGETTVACGLQSCGINDTHLVIPIVIASRPQAARQSRGGQDWIVTGQCPSQ